MGKKSLAAIVGAIAAAALLVFTPSQEGTVLKTYKDMGGVLTYCTGATENAIWGKTYTIAECKTQLDSDLARHAEGVMQCIHVPLNDGQKVAFVDTAYNIGIKAFCGSSMARNANAGYMAQACESLMLWIKVGSRTVQGLINRRMRAREICLKGIA